MVKREYTRTHNNQPGPDRMKERVVQQNLHLYVLGLFLIIYYEWLTQKNNTQDERVRGRYI